MSTEPPSPGPGSANLATDAPSVAVGRADPQSRERGSRSAHEPAPAPSAWRRLRALIGLFTAQGFSRIGNTITMIAVPLYVLQETGDPMAVGVAGVFATAPVALGATFGGVFADRLGYRRSSIIADVASGVTVLAMPILASTIGLPFWALLALVFGSGLLDAPGNTAKEVLVPTLAEQARVPLTRAAGAQSATSRTASMVGAAIAAGTVVWLGPLNSLIVNAVTFAVAVMVMAVLVPRPEPGPAPAIARTPKQRAAAPAKPSFWRELADGVRFLAAKPLLRNIVLLVVVTNCFDAAGMTVLWPMYARTVSADGAILGVMTGLFAAGALTGAAIFGIVAHRLPRRALLIASFFLAGAPVYGVTAAGLPVPVVLVVIALSGLAAGSINPLFSTVLYEQVPDGIRARVFGALTAGVTLAMPLGSLIGGFTVAQIGLGVTLAVVAVLYGAVTLTPLVGRSWRQLDAQPSGAADRIESTGSSQQVAG